MTLDPVMSAERTRRLVDDLRAKPAETTWIEFKENNADGPLIGKLISALSNAARLADQHFAYVVWGVRDGDQIADRYRRVKRMLLAECFSDQLVAR